MLSNFQSFGLGCSCEDLRGVKGKGRWHKLRYEIFNSGWSVGPPVDRPTTIKSAKLRHNSSPMISGACTHVMGVTNSDVHTHENEHACKRTQILTHANEQVCAHVCTCTRTTVGSTWEVSVNCLMYTTDVIERVVSNKTVASLYLDFHIVVHCARFMW